MFSDWLTIINLEKELANITLLEGNEGRKICLQEELKISRDRMESIYRQKSRQIWLKERDKNTTFFKISTLIQRRNIILVIKDRGDWIQEEDGITEYFIKQFKELFTTSNPVFTEEITDLENKIVTEKESLELAEIPSSEEIKESIWQLHPLKSPGSDGFLGLFYWVY